MSEPIINPWAFYLISLCDKVSTVSTITTMFFVVMAVLLTIGMVSDGDPDDKSLRKMVVILYAVGGVSALMAVFVPSGTTVTAMVAASNITPATVAAVGQTATEAAEAITQVIVQTIKEVR